MRHIEASDPDFYCYGIFDHEQKKCYIGVTANPRQRYRQHTKDKAKLKFFGDRLPTMTIIASGLNTLNVAEAEMSEIVKYKKLGYETFNKSFGGEGVAYSLKPTENNFRYYIQEVFGNDVFEACIQYPSTLDHFANKLPEIWGSIAIEYNLEKDFYSSQEYLKAIDEYVKQNHDFDEEKFFDSEQYKQACIKCRIIDPCIFN